MSDERENIDPNKENVDDEKENSESEEVKSKAIVKYSVPNPSNFVKLQCNTDLNLPPANWLSSSADSYGLQKVTPSQKGFSSFRMAQMYPDCVGEVDVVSDAENIKKLLKLPYNKESISMVIHRIENTLLIDNFDIYKHFMMSKDQGKEWTWLQKFIMEHVGRKALQENRQLYVQDRTREALKQKSLVSKFLYHSLMPTNQNNELMLDNDRNQAHCSRSVDYPVLPEPPPNVEAPDNDSFSHSYNRNVVWTFEDIQMLLGTDMPIFGEGTYPCISLRLRDMTKPINILTGIDYWLDNMMSNVPEVVMCYHLKGIVQKYELIKTEDLPRLDNSKFSPKVIRDVAQNILSFLKTNATKAGHTYWLFKGKDEEVIKLYDLTCLVPQDENLQNPFTIPVAMLLYRLARSFMKTGEKRRPPATIRTLLKNCLKLLSEEKYPEIAASSHFMLSEVYIPIDTNPGSPSFGQDDADDESIYSDDDRGYDEEDDADSDDPSNAIKYLDLADDVDDAAGAGASSSSSRKFANKHRRKPPPPPVTGTAVERCLEAAAHVAKGLNCLKYFTEEEMVGEQQQEEGEGEPMMARPSEPIPMGYEPLNSSSSNNNNSNGNNAEEEDDGGGEASGYHGNRSNVEEEERGESSSVGKKGKKSKDKKKKREKSPDKTKESETDNALLVKNVQQTTESMPTWKKKNVKKDGISWKDHLKILLYEKSQLVYATLSEHHYVSGKYGSSLRTIGLLARCSSVMDALRSTNQLRENCLLARAGDCFVMIAQNFQRVEDYRTQFYDYRREDLLIMQQLENDENLYRLMLGERNIRCVFIYEILNVEQMLLKGVECYEEALKVAESDDILRRLGNSLNEAGMYYLNVAKTCPKKTDIIDTAARGLPYLIRALDAFKKVKDEANVALIYTNLGHLHRLFGYACAPAVRGELTRRERSHFHKSFANYREALRILGARGCNPSIWDTVNWELSTALFSMAIIMHENPPEGVPIAEAEKEVLETLQKALQYCDLTREDNPKFPLYQYRAALIHYRIASLYHKHAISTVEDVSTKKKIVQLSRINYEKSARLYFASRDVINYFTAQMQKIGLIESLAESAGNPNAKLKHFQSCLDVILELREMTDMLATKKVPMPEQGKQNCHCDVENGEVRTFDTIFALLKLVKQRLQHVLKNLLKLCTLKCPPNRDCPKMADVYKECYKVTFALGDDLKQNELLVCLNDVLVKIKVIVDDSDR